MDSTRDHRHRVAAAAQVDRFFDDYEIEMAADEVLSFAATAPFGNGSAETVYALIDALNRTIPAANFGPNHPRTGTPHHKFRVGRRHGDRAIVLELFKGYFGSAYPFDDLVETIRKHAQKADCIFSWESDENVHHFTFVWPSRTNS